MSDYQCVVGNSSSRCRFRSRSRTDLKGVRLSGEYLSYRLCRGSVKFMAVEGLASRDTFGSHFPILIELIRWCFVEIT